MVERGGKEGERRDLLCLACRISFELKQSSPQWEGMPATSALASTGIGNGRKCVVLSALTNHLSSRTCHFLSKVCRAQAFVLLTPPPCSCTWEAPTWHSQLALGPGWLSYKVSESPPHHGFSSLIFPSKLHYVFCSNWTTSFDFFFSFALKPVAFLLNVISWLPSFSLAASIYFLFIKLKIGLQAALICFQEWDSSL